MSFIFPPTPALNQIVINGIASFKWDGAKWLNARAISTWVGIPEAPPTGDLYARDGLAQDWEDVKDITNGGTF